MSHADSIHSALRAPPGLAPAAVPSVSGGFFAELKRRNVYRAAAFYAAASWLLVQIATQVFPFFDIPNWSVRMVVVAAVVGFPFAMLFSWFYELTPQGIRRESDIEPSDSIVHVTGKKLDRWIIATLALAVVLLLTDKLVLRKASDAAAPAVTNAAPAASAKSIAVLPFTDLSPAHDQEYFSDGMAEEILDALAQLSDLKVAGRTSSFYFKGKNEDLRTIGKALGVANILEGSVRKQGDKVRITAQLIQTETGFHLWSESYDGSLTDVFELQERIARAIAEHLKVVLIGDQKTRLAQSTTQSTEAHQQYLRGQYFWHQRGYQNLQNAVTAYKTALQADPEYADAWAALAQVYAILPEYYDSDPNNAGAAPETVTLALDAANHALRVDPASSAALLARAYIRGARQFDWNGAEADFRSVIASNPQDATAHQWYGEILTYQRRLEEAGVQIDAALAIDPLSAIKQHLRGFVLVLKGDPAKALPYLDESLRIAPGFYFAQIWKLLALVELHRFDDAMAVTQELPEGRRELKSSFVAAMKDASKRDAVAVQIAKGGSASDPASAIMLVLLGRNDLALDALERSFAVREPFRAYAYANVLFDPLRADPRFQALMRQVNLPPAAGADGVKAR
jgi:TolB-like protein/Tfp pilus assembly protein PilF